MSVEPEGDPLRRLASLLTGGEEASAALADRLRLSRVQRDRLAGLADRGAGLTAETAPQALRRTIYRLGAPRVCDRVLLAWAGDPSDRRFAALLALAEAWRPPDFPLKGRDALALGLPAGPAVGDLLAAIEEDWIGRDFDGDRASLLAELERLAEAAGRSS